jgi:hypothetical protein
LLRGSIYRFRVVVFDFRRLCAGVTHLRPLSQRGGLKCYFLIGNENVVWGSFGSCILIGNEGEVAWLFPLLRGDEGVCYGEERGIG